MGSFGPPQVVSGGLVYDPMIVVGPENNFLLVKSPIPHSNTQEVIGEISMVVRATDLSAGLYDKAGIRGKGGRLFLIRITGNEFTFVMPPYSNDGPPVPPMPVSSYGCLPHAQNTEVGGLARCTSFDNTPVVAVWAYESVAVMLKVFVPAVSGLLAVSTALRWVYVTPPMVNDPAVIATAVDPVVTFETFAVTLVIALPASVTEA